MAVGAMGAAPSNTYIETTAVGVKEDLRDLIFQIDVDATPMLSAISSVPSQQILTEWVVQDLGAVADNAQPEGFTAVAQPVTKPVRFNNVCQIVVRSVGVSNTTRAADFVGSEDEYNRQVILKGMEAKRDVEFAITSPLVRTLTDPRHMSGLPCYTLNGSRGAGAGVMPVGDGSNAGTPGTARDLTLAMVDAAVQQCWQAGSVPTLGIMSGNVKAYFATLSQGGTGNAVVAQNIQNVTSNRLLGNPTSNSAALSEISLGTTFLFSGSTLRTASATGDVTWASNSFATTIANSAVTYAKMQFVASNRLLGNASSVAAAPSEITLGTTFAFVTNALQTLSGTGDVTWASNSFATTIANAAVTLGKMSSLTGSSFIANNTGSPATPLAVSASNAAAMLSSQVQVLNTTMGNPTGTNSTGFVMMGFGGTAKLTPTFGTRVEVTFYGAITNNTASGGGDVQLRFGTGTAPSNQSASTGTSVGGALPGSGAIAGQFIPYTLPNIVTGLTPGTQYWFDVALLALTGGTASLINNCVVIREF